MRALRVWPILALVLCPPLPGAARAAERPLTLAEAIELALRHNDDIIVQRQGVEAADAGIIAAKGAYDPVLNAAGGWHRSSPPVNSAFSGAPVGSLSPTTEGLDASASVSQLLPTGGQVLARTSAFRDTTNNDFTLLTPAYSTQVGVQVRQPLLRNRAMDEARLELRVSAAESGVAGATLRQAVSDALAQVEETYWRLAAARRAVTVQEEAVRLAEEQLEQTRVRIEMGVAPDTEISQPRAELERRRGDLLATREAASRVQNALKLLILDDPGEDPGQAGGSFWSDDLVPADPPDVTVQVVDIAESLRQALELRPEVAAAKATVQMRQAESEFARDGVKPALDAVLSYDRFGLAGDVNEGAIPVPGINDPSGDLEGGWGRSYAFIGDGDFEDARAQVVFGLPLGNRTAKATAVQAVSAQRQAEAELARTRKNVRADVLDSASSLQTAGQRIEAARAARQAAEVQLSAEQDRYDNGLSTNFLVLTRQNDLSSARLDEINAVTDYLRARAELARATGTLLEARHIQVED
ncbi:MAG: TolC family protein [Candidatus Polarisedimenticolia bacterium]